MVTREQAIEAGAQWGHAEFHYTGRHDCARTVGPRGGVYMTVSTVRVSGRCKTWKTRPADFRLPVKYGLYESSAIEAHNAADFHLAEECPLSSRTTTAVESYGQDAADGAACRAMATALNSVKRS